MSDINEIRISGTILRDPVLRRTKADHDMCTMQVSVSRPEPSKACDYLDVMLWEDLASKVVSDFHAGEKIMITGRLRKSSYTGMDGKRHTTTQIIAEHAERPAEADLPYFANAAETVPVESLA